MKFDNPIRIELDYHAVHTYKNLYQVVEPTPLIAKIERQLYSELITQLITELGGRIEREISKSIKT